jgi:hypothetical protein
MNLSVKDIDGDIIVVSHLHSATTKKFDHLTLRQLNPMLPSAFMKALFSS